MALLLYATGAFTLLLGLFHFFFPLLLDFEHAIPKTGSPIKPFRVAKFSYPTLRSDVHGIGWVMNHAASYVLVTVGLVDLTWVSWINTPISTLLCLWVAGWWFLRASTQFYLGQRGRDWLVVIWFIALGIVHVVVGVMR